MPDHFQFLPDLPDDIPNGMIIGKAKLTGIRPEWEKIIPESVLIWCDGDVIARVVLSELASTK